jgi:hypothetical protein
MNLILKGKDVELTSHNCEIKVKNEFDIQEFLYVDARFYNNLIPPDVGFDKDIQTLKDKLNLVTEIGFNSGFQGSYSCYRDNLSLDCITDETILILEGVLYLCMNIVFVRKDQQ